MAKTREEPRLRPDKYDWEPLQNENWEGEFWPKMIFFVIVLVIAMFISAVVIDVGGRSEREHPYAIPKTVERISGKRYVIRPGAKTQPVDVCWGNGGTSSGTDRVEFTHRFREGTYVQCGETQSFNPKLAGAPVSKNFGNGLVGTWTNPLSWLIVGGCILLSLPWFRWSYKFRRARWKNWEAKRRAEINDSLEEQRLREIVQAFARCDIDKEEYDAGLQRAYLAGVPPATGE